MSKFLMTALSCMLGFNTLAQFTISGAVRHSKSNEALVGATIQIEDQSRGAITDEQGHFELKNVKAGKQILSVRFLGYMDEKKEVEISADMQLDFALNESSQLTDEVT